MEFNDAENRFDSFLPRREDKFDYRYFSPEDSPEGVLLAKQIQAQSYINMRIVRPEGLITLANGAQILSPMATDPSGSPPVPDSDSYMEYALGVEKGAVDISPITGQMVAWRKYYSRLDALPAYQFCKDVLWPEGEHYLRHVEEDPNLVLVEPEGLGKTKNAGGGVVKEFIRSEVQRVMGRGEVWFMGLVEGTAYESFVHNWGSTAVRQIGASRQIANPYVHDDIALVPTVMDIDHFYDNMASDILTTGNKSVERQIINFVYMSEGVSSAVLGPELTEFRDWARDIVRSSGGDV